MESPLRVLVVDDEALARSRMARLLAEVSEPRCTLVGQAAHADEARALLEQHAVDVVLLDIHMPGADGLSLAKQIGQLPRPPRVVFVTAHAGHALEAFEVQATDYLTKPVRAERLAQALSRVAQALPQSAPAPEATASEAHVVVNSRGKTERVPLAAVLFIKAELKYLTLRTASGEHVLEGSLQEWEQREPQRWLRVHRSALVARNALQALERDGNSADADAWVVKLVGLNDAVPVSRRQLTAVREALAK